MRRACEGQDIRPAEVPDSRSQFLSYNFSYSVFPQTAADKQADVSEESYDSPRQAGFQPPLYLQCGPLLRFTGIYRKPRKEEPSSRDGTEIWEGSVMVVTVDAMSSYMKPPTLWLFEQPVDLQTSGAQKSAPSGHQLAAEFADPLTGQFKMSRVGKPLYVKPVGSLQERRDLSCDDDNGLFETTEDNQTATTSSDVADLYPEKRDSNQRHKVYEIIGTRLHAERGFTFWKFKLEIPLGPRETRIIYHINHGTTTSFWLPAKGHGMNVMFQSCNGFSLSVDPDPYSGPDPLWRDVLNAHQKRPFHLMIGGGDQIYNDACRVQTRYFKKWTGMKNSGLKQSLPFSAEMQGELEDFYLTHYASWFSRGLFGMANSQIPMINIWDDHDIIDGYGSYPHNTMATPVFKGLGAVAFKYYMLFQHQSVPEETEQEEQSWLLGAEPGPYIEEFSRSIFTFLGSRVAFLGLDCRTERTRNQILCQNTWDLVLGRCKEKIVKGEVEHLIVLLGVPIAYPRLNFLENALTSKAIEPLKALGRMGIFGNLFNKFDSGFEILDDLEDHWTAKHHKLERNWFIRQLQDLAAAKSVRITILGGDVHLAAVGQFYSNRKLGIPQSHDHRYMVNIISSAIVNRPPATMLANLINRRNKVHHLDKETDEDMVSMFQQDVDGKSRRNTHLLPRRNWCSLLEHNSGGLNICINVEKVQGNPAGTSVEYPFFIPTLDYRKPRKLIKERSKWRRWPFLGRSAEKR